MGPPASCQQLSKPCVRAPHVTSYSSEPWPAAGPLCHTAPDSHLAKLAREGDVAKPKAAALRKGGRLRTTRSSPSRRILSQPTIGSDPRARDQVRISLRDVASQGRWPSSIGTCQREGGTGRHGRTPLYAEAWNRSLEKHSLPVALDHHRRDLPCSVKVPHALSEHANGVSCHLVEADISVPGADKCSRYLCTAKIRLFFACEVRRKKPRCKQRGEI